MSVGLVPTWLPLPLAKMNAAHGVPTFGAFSFAPAPPDQLMGWTFAIPWALALAGRLPGRSALVCAPTLAGVAWVLASHGAWACLEGHHDPAMIRALNTCRGAGVVARPPPGQPGSLAPFPLALRLDPYAPIPSAEELAETATWLAPRGRLVLAGAVEPGERLRPPVGWCCPVAEEASHPAPWDGLLPADGEPHPAALRTERGAMLAMLVLERAP